jgi:hypothetical protein
MRINYYLLLSAFMFLALLLSSCGSEVAQDFGNNNGKASISFCAKKYGEKFYMFKGIDIGDAEGAIEGSINDSRAIVSVLLNRWGDGAPDNLSACQLIFWTDLSAQNGDLNSAYEVASIDYAGDGYMCRRSKYWAKRVIARMNEFRLDALPGSDADMLRRSIDGRSKQMKLAVQRKCSEV